MAELHYLFIDGGYLRARHAEALRSVFGETGEVDLSAFRHFYGSSQFQRVFYYDCLHDIPKTNESEAELKVRIEAQQAFFDELQTLEGFHVRLGSLSGSSRKFRQKEVDILLAVDVLDHAFRKNMASATLLAGDLDFAPLVEALVRLGTWVEIWYDEKSFAKHLLEVSDNRKALKFQDYYVWSRHSFKQAHALPQFQQNVHPDPTGKASLRQLKSGAFGNEKIYLYERDNEYVLYLPSVGSRSWSHADAAVLENYFAVTEGKITWE